MVTLGLMVAMGLARPDEGGLIVRFGSVSLVPEEALPLGGYTARGESVFEPGGEDLRARVLVFEQGSQKVALVNLEMLTVPESLVEAVRELIPKGMDLMMVATHTHCAPDSQMLNRKMTFRIPGIAPYNRKWAGWYAGRIAEAVNSALEADGIRVTESWSGESVVDLNRGRREGAQPSRALRTLRVGGWEVVNYAAHATLFDETRLKLSGDWPGAVMRSGKRIVLPAAIGDVSPKFDGGSGEARVKGMAEGLVKGLPKAGGVGGTGIVFAQEPIDFGAPTPHPEFAKDFGTNDALAKLVVDKFAPEKSALTMFTIGDVLILGVPGEPTSEVGAALRQKFLKRGWKSVWIVSHVNGWAGYLLMPADYDRGGYEATLQFFGRGAALRVLDAGEKLAERVKPGVSLARR